MHETDLRTRCTSVRLAFADHMDRFITGSSCAKLLEKERKCWLSGAPGVESPDDPVPEYCRDRRGQEKHPGSLSRGDCKIATLPSFPSLFRLSSAENAKGS